jgi:hypothetical protein
MPTNFPGLIPFSEDRPDIGGRIRGRAQVQDTIRPEALRPTASNIDTYARPQQPTQDDTLLQLAQGLAQINPALRTAAAGLSVDQQQQAEVDAKLKIGGMTHEEAAEAVKNGTLSEFSNPWFRAAFNKQYGLRFGATDGSDLYEQWKAQSDKSGLNIDDFVAKRIKERADSLTDKHVKAGYLASMQPWVTAMHEGQAKWAADETVKQTNDGVASTFLNIARSGIAKGDSPKTIADNIRSQYAGQAQLLKVSMRDQDKILLGVANSLAADGNYDVVKQLLSDDRGGVGAIADKAELAPHAIEVMNLAKRKSIEKDRDGTFQTRLGFHEDADMGRLDEKKLELFRQVNPGVVTDEQAMSLVQHSRRQRDALLKAALHDQQKIDQEAAYLQYRDGITQNDLRVGYAGNLSLLSSLKISNREGREEILSADERRRAAVEMFLKRSEQVAIQTGETPEQRFAREAKFFSDNGVANPQWKDLLAAGPTMANAESINRGQVPEPLAKAADLYARLYAANPRLLSMHLGGDNAHYDFYEAIRLGKMYQGLNDGQAFAQALAATNDPTHFQGQLTKQRWDALDSKLRSLGSVLPWKDDVENGGMVGTELERLARFYSAVGGLTADRAIEEAQKRIAATYTNVNGWLVYTGNISTPPGATFAKMVDDHLSRWVEQFGNAEGVEKRDLTLRPTDANGTTVWTIVHKDGMPVFAGPRAFTLDMLKAAEEKRAVVARDKAATDAAQAAEDRLTPWYSDHFFSFGPVSFKGFTKEEERIIEQNRQKQRQQAEERMKAAPPSSQEFSPPL